MVTGNSELVGASELIGSLESALESDFKDENPNSDEKKITKDFPVHWPLWKLIGFRFVFVYLMVYTVPGEHSWLGWMTTIKSYVDDLYHKIVPWVGTYVLHLSQPITIFSNGSGDTTYDWVRVACFLVLAASVTVIWSILDRKTFNYVFLHQWLRLELRLVLIAALMSYGALKVFPTQFMKPGLYTLIETYGESSPMHLLWTFMGASPPYTVLCGLAEMVAGVLIMIAPWTTAGSLLSAAVMGNVFALNMCYDVPVKIYSFHLFAISLFLLVPEMKRLFSIFFLNRPTIPIQCPPLFRHRRAQLVVAWIPVLVGSYLGFTKLIEANELLAKYGPSGTSPLYGVWNVELVDMGQISQAQSARNVISHAQMPLNNGVAETGSSETSTKTRKQEESKKDGPQPKDANGKENDNGPGGSSSWKQVIFEGKSWMLVVSDTGQRYLCIVNLNQAKHLLQIQEPHSQKFESLMAYSQPNKDTLCLKGELAKRKIDVTLKRMPAKNFLLVNRGFHWINEHPFNR